MKLKIQNEKRLTALYTGVWVKISEMIESGFHSKVELECGEKCTSFVIDCIVTFNFHTSFSLVFQLQQQPPACGVSSPFGFILCLV